MGLVNKVVEHQHLEKAVSSFAQKLILENSAQSMQRTKRMIAKVQEMPLEEALEYAAGQNAKARNSEDCKQGIKAFLSKTSIKW